MVELNFFSNINYNKKNHFNICFSDLVGCPAISALRFESCRGLLTLFVRLTQLSVLHWILLYLDYSANEGIGLILV